MRGPLFSSSYIDVGFGCPLELSSSAAHAAFNVLVPSREPGTPSFQTDQQNNPWAIIDLGAVRLVKRIRVFNLEPASHRVLPLTLSASIDKEAWRDLVTVHYQFGGTVSDSPLEIAFRHPMAMRYLRLSVRANTRLGLDYVEIDAATPATYWGRVVDVQVTPQALTARWLHSRGFGFSWTFTSALKAIRLARSYGIHVTQIDFSAALADFKDEPGRDVYEELFAPEPSLVPSLRDVPDFDHHGRYAAFTFDKYRLYLQAYFQPSRRVRDKAEEWAAAYDIRPENTIAIVYRGTDKDKEVQLAPIESYIKVAQYLRRQDTGLQLCVQTDQAEALETVLAAIPDAVYVRELPVTTGKVVIHRHKVEQEFGLARMDLAIGLLAVTWLYATCKYVVCHTGNIGLWVALYRGHSTGFYQFDRDAKLCDPAGQELSLDDLP